MPESGLPANKIDELRRRFEEQPASRIFLQLAEEYRRLGLPEQAIEVFEAGLAKRPGDLSGMVALGRCRLELGHLALAVDTLEAVISRDAAHLVANKLLVEVHLQQGDPERAGQRLELYKLLNDRDPEIDDLETRLKALRRGVRETAEAAAIEAAALPTAPAIEELPSEAPTTADPFALASPHVELSAPAPLVEPVVPAPQAIAMAPIATETHGIVFALGPLPALTLDALWQASDARPRTLFRRVEPFGVLPPAGAQDLRSMLSRGVVFPPLIPIAAAPLAEIPIQTEAPIEEEAPVAEVPILEALPIQEERAIAAAPIAAAQLEPALTDEPELEPEIPAPTYEPVESTVEVSAADVLASRPQLGFFENAFENEPSTVAIDLPEPVDLPPAARLEPEIPAATVTLAELYLAQGHVVEARRIFAEVLERDPSNALARKALARLEPSLQRLTAANLLALLPAGEVPQGLTAKKILVLSAYLQRLRRRHVR